MKRTKKQAAAPPVTGLAGLADAELAEVALGNWHQLNAVLRFRQPIEVLKRLLALERSRDINNGPRQNVLVRLTRALNRAEGRARLEAL